MRQILMFSLIMLVLPSCKKDKVPKEEPCSNVELTGKRAAVVGTWRWDRTKVYHNFTSGTMLLYSTPATEGFDYYCIITADGKYRGYRDSILVDEFDMTSIIQDYDSGMGKYSLSSLRNCGEEQINLAIFTNNSSEELAQLQFPLYFKESNKYTSYNYFKRI